MKYVYRVVPQRSLDKTEAWKELKFDVVFYGDDWKNTSVYNEIESKLVKCGVKIVYLPHTEGISTSELVENNKQGYFGAIIEPLMGEYFVIYEVLYKALNTIGNLMFK